ncbi:HdeD family acid-resistance protein [Saccharopolyspora rosea]|uniref:HdeD family acid-resistance protein n=1 Tax=Saccharopolyspora rosea TaxID=524884 RepID=A0ABW3FVY4_9PSEU|nr:HdeD family acid-resistance protein [Saccharopolyspora rosea]
MSHAQRTETSADRIAGSWGWLLAFGILTVLAGVAALVSPGPTVLVLSIVFGVQLLIGGIYWLAQALIARDGTAARIVLAVLAVLAGVIVLRSPVAAALVFPLVLGSYWLISGLVETVHSVADRSTPSRGWAITSGVLSVLAGIALLVYPGIGLLTMTYLLGIWLLVYGALAAGRAIQLRPRTTAEVRTPPQAGPAHA